MAFGGSLNAAGTSLTLTGVSAGATILVWPQTNSGNATAFTVSDGQASYAARGNIYGTSGDTNTQAFILTGANAGSHVITVGATGDTIFGLVAAWWTGYGDVDNALAAIHGAPVTSSTTGADALNSGNITTTTAGCLIIGIAFDINNAATTLSAGTSPIGFTQQVLGNVGGAEPFILEDFTQSTAAAISATAGTTASINAVTEVIALAPTGTVVTQGISIGTDGPGRSPGKTGARFQQFRLSTSNPSSLVSGAFSGSSASAAVFPLAATGLLAFTGSSASSASFGLSASIAFSGSSASSSIVPVGGGIGIRGASASTASFAPSLNAGLAGSSASTSTFSLLGSGAITINVASASSAIFNATAVSAGSSFVGSSASAATFDLSASTGLLAFRGASASAAVVDPSGSIGRLTFNGVSASIATVDVQPLTSGSIFFAGSSASSATFTISGPFTPPAIIAPAGALLPGVAGKRKPLTALELEGHEPFPWQATGAPIVPSPYMGASESIVPIASVAPPVDQMFPVKQIIAPTEDEAVLLLMLLGASL